MTVIKSMYIKWLNSKTPYYVKVQISSCKINTTDMMYNMINIINTGVCYI